MAWCGKQHAELGVQGVDFVSIVRHYSLDHLIDENFSFIQTYPFVLHCPKILEECEGLIKFVEPDWFVCTSGSIISRVPPCLKNFKTFTKEDRQCPNCATLFTNNEMLNIIQYMLGIKCQLRARLPTTLLSFHNTMKKIKELNEYRDKYRLLLFNYERSKNQKVKARNTMNRLCECIIEDNVL